MKNMNLRLKRKKEKKLEGKEIEKEIEHYKREKESEHKTEE